MLLQQTITKKENEAKLLLAQQLMEKERTDMALMQKQQVEFSKNAS